MQQYAALTHSHSLACTHAYKHIQYVDARKDFDMRVHKPVGFDITAVVGAYTEMPSAYKDMQIQSSPVGLYLCVRQSILSELGRKKWTLPTNQECN